MDYFDIGFIIILATILYILMRLEKRIIRVEKELIPFLKELDDKNYRLWKAKVKAEEQLKKS